ncbi:MAG: peptide/nickel transport system substrate-binding protein [Acidobacteriota bacterium]|nr:peptide/nickel transport system substrate-binding protein [Acidobacteriota bacterium]
MSDDTPQDGGTLIRRLDVDVATMNPVLSTSKYDHFPAQYLFTPLIYFDRELKPIPGLAESWDVSDDGLLYTFKLNPKATFSDGMPVRASDVVYTLRKIIDPASEAVQIAGSFEYIDMTRTRAVDATTVEIAFKEALASQLVRFNEVLVLPEHVYGKGNFRDDFVAKAVGSGPYRLLRREPGKQIILERRADYWGQKPHIQTVVFKIIGDSVTAWNAVKRGDIDEAMMVSDTWVREQKNPQLMKTINFQRFYTLNYNYIAWNTRDALLSDKRIRRAFTMCVPVDAVINDLYHGTARAMSGPFTPDEWAYNPAVPVVRYDPEGAKRILVSLGWLDKNGDGILEKNGKPLKFDILIIPGTATTTQFAQMLQAELKKIGVQMEIVMLEGGTAIQRILGGNYQATYLGWDLDPDPDPYALFHSSQFPPRGQNFTFYSNPEVDRLIEQGRRELDQDKRRDIYHRLHVLLADDQPYTWTTQVSVKWALSKRIHGVELSRGYGLYLWYPGELAWWIPKDQQRRSATAQ